MKPPPEFTGKAKVRKTQVEPQAPTETEASSWTVSSSMSLGTFGKAFFGDIGFSDKDWFSGMECEAVQGLIVNNRDEDEFESQ